MISDVVLHWLFMCEITKKNGVICEKLGVYFMYKIRKKKSSQYGLVFKWLTDATVRSYEITSV